MAWGKLVGIMFAVFILLLLIVFFFGPSGYGPKILTKVSHLADQYLKLGEGESGRQADQIQEYFKVFYEDVKDLSESKDTHCFRKMILPDDFGKFAFVIEDNFGKMEVSLFQKGGSQISRGTIEKVKPCAVIYNFIPENFYNNWFADPKSDLNMKDFNEVEKIWIESNDIWINSDDNYKNGDKRRFNIKYFYKPDKDHICVIPTYNYITRWSCGGYEEGLTKECADDFRKMVGYNLCD